MCGQTLLIGQRDEKALLGPWLFEGLSSPLEINSLIERTVGSVTFTRGMPGFTTDIIHSSFFFTLVTESSSAKEHRLTAAIRALAKQREKEKESTQATEMKRGHP